MRSKLLFYTLTVAIAAATFSSNAEAQCDVTADDPVELDDNGCSVYVAVNHLTGNPAVAWVSDNASVAVSRYDGSSWSAAQTVDTGGVLPAPSEVDTPHHHMGLALAIDSCGVHHIMIASDEHLHHFMEEAGGGWSEGEIVTDVIAPNPDDPHLQVRADFDGDDVLHVVYAIDGGNEASGKGVRYVKLDETGWSEPLHIAGGPFMHMNVGEDGSVHVTYLQFHGMEGDWRNYQGHYRQRTAGGTWLEDEQATDEDPVGELGPVAIHPAVDVGPDGTVHMVYPMDPPDPHSSGGDRGHASTIDRTGGTWSSDAPVELFPNGIHAAFVDVAADAAGVVYAIGVNWERRFKADTGSGFGDVGSWDEPGGRWFYHSVIDGPAGAWIAYVAERRIGPIRVALLRRTGDCGVFCGDGECGSGEDGCSCKVDCARQCCIGGAAYAAEEAMTGDPCSVCRPADGRCAWTYDPAAPGCEAEEAAPEPVLDEPAPEIVDAGVDTIDDAVSDVTDVTRDTAMPDVPDDAASEDAGTTSGGCGCAIVG